MDSAFKNKWGESPWRWRVARATARVPARADFVVIGGGFSGLSAATWLGRMGKGKKIALVEADELGAGASGRTGGMALAETAGGGLPGLGDVLGGFGEILRELKIECDYFAHGAWELGRRARSDDARQHPGKNSSDHSRTNSGNKSGDERRTRSEISWADSGTLRVVHEVPGGTVDAGKLLGGLARAASRANVAIVQGRAVSAVKHGGEIRVALDGGEIATSGVLIATNAQSLELAGLQEKATPKLTMGVATAPLRARAIRAIGLASRRPFYTVDLPYLWGRLRKDNSAIFGAGLVSVENWEELHALDVRRGQAAELLASLKERVRGLHPAMREVNFTHAWGGPILLTEKARPIFRRIRAGQNIIYLGGYNGHGVALSVYLGRWAAAALLGTRALPRWN